MNKLAADACVDRMAVAAADEEEQEDRRPQDRFFSTAITLALRDPVEPHGDQQHEQRRERRRAGQQAEGDQDATEEFGERQQRRPEHAGIEAEAFDHARRRRGIADLAEAMGDERHPGDDAQDGFDAFMG